MAPEPRRGSADCVNVADKTVRPCAVDGLEVTEADDGLVVYVEATETIHHLNRTAAIVFGLCDGARDAPAIADELGLLFSLDAPPLAETVECLAELERLGLIA